MRCKVDIEKKLTFERDNFIAVLFWRKAYSLTRQEVKIPGNLAIMAVFENQPKSLILQHVKGTLYIFEFSRTKYIKVFVWNFGAKLQILKNKLNVIFLTQNSNKTFFDEFQTM